METFATQLGAKYHSYIIFFQWKCTFLLVGLFLRTICVDLRLRLIPIPSALKLVLCNVICDTRWLCELSSKKKSISVLLTLLVYPECPPFAVCLYTGTRPLCLCNILRQLHGVFLSQWIRPCKAMQVRWHVHPFIRGSIYLFFNDSNFLV